MSCGISGRSGRSGLGADGLGGGNRRLRRGGGRLGWRGLCRRSLLGGGFLNGRWLFGLLVSDEALPLSLTTDPVGLCVLDARRMRLYPDAEVQREVECLLVRETELLCELVDADLCCQRGFASPFLVRCITAGCPGCGHGSLVSRSGGPGHEVGCRITGDDRAGRHAGRRLERTGPATGRPGQCHLDGQQAPDIPQMLGKARHPVPGVYGRYAGIRRAPERSG